MLFGIEIEFYKESNVQLWKQTHLRFLEVCVSLTSIQTLGGIILNTTMHHCVL